MPMPQRKITTARAKVAPRTGARPTSASAPAAAQAAPAPQDSPGISEHALRAAQGENSCVWASLVLVFTGLIAFFAVLILVVHAGEQKLAPGFRASIGVFGSKLGTGANAAQMQAAEAIREVQSNIEGAESATTAANNAASRD